jgi:hypothetical protein
MNFILNKKNDLLNWVIGFAEGDGSFGVSSSPETGTQHVFVITQKDPKVLYKVKKYMGFGRVERHGDYFRYIVGDIIGTSKIIELFNGRLCLEKTHKRFTVYVDYFNKRICLKKYERLKLLPITVKERRSLIDFETYWFSGFIDAEGCFSTVITEKTRRLRFIVDQKDEMDVLQQIRVFIGMGSIYTRKTTNYRYQYSQVISDIEDKLVQYLKNFPLQSQKSVDYIRWKKLRYRFLDGECRKGRSLKRLQRLNESLKKRKVIQNDVECKERMIESKSNLSNLKSNEPLNV